MRSLLVGAFALSATLAGTVTTADDPVGTTFSGESLEDFALTEAGSFDDYAGRAVLLEFFAHW